MIASPEFIKDRLQEGGIKQAAVIDEAFDADKAVARVTTEEAFWAEIDAQPTWKTELEAKGIPCVDLETLKLDGLPKLWEHRKEFSEPVTQALSTLFVDAEQNLADPQAVADHLSSLGLKVATVGTKPKKPAGTDMHALPSIPDDVQLVFLDYDLEGDSRFESTQRTRMSELVASNLAQRKERTPFLVLFSNKPNARSLAEGFRKRTGYLRGTFVFISKEDARDLAKLCTRLADTCVGMKGLGHLQHFFFALKRRLAEVAKAVESEVMQLNVQDHAFIQRLALQEEGASLGEYMLDFFGAVLSHELRDGEEVQEARRQLDAFPFEDRHFPFSELPSAPIQRLYRAVLTEPGVVDASPHPRALKGHAKSTNGTTYNAPPLLMLGDIFAKNARKPVYVVMNPACDLQYAPSRRDPKLENSVLLMHGRLESLKKPRSNSSGLRMEWLMFGKQNWRVAWEHQRVESVPLANFDKWRKKNGYKRIARLSLPYSLKLQQMWLAELGRVGLPVNLPFYDAFDVQLLGLDPSGKWVPVGSKIKRAAVVSRHPRESKEVFHFTLTPTGRNVVYQQLETSVQSLQPYPLRLEAAKALLNQTKIWNEGLTETPHKFTNDCHEDIIGILFAWRSRPNLKGLAPLTGDQRTRLSENERKAIAKQEKVALIAVINPPRVDPAPAQTTMN
jgi:hypothetical protein